MFCCCILLGFRVKRLWMLRSLLSSLSLGRSLFRVEGVLGWSVFDFGGLGDLV